LIHFYKRSVYQTVLYSINCTQGDSQCEGLSLEITAVSSQGMDVFNEDILKAIGVSSEDVISQDGPEFPHAFPVINKEIALWIDQELDWEDAVSFAFLVVDKNDIALKLMNVIEMNKCNILNKDDQNNKNVGILQVVFLSAVKNGATTSWQSKVYEALFLIGYKKLLYDMGIDDEQAEEKFQSGVQLKADRRLLFKLCQELEMNDQARLLQCFQDTLAQSGQTVLRVSMMESHFLHLLMQNQLKPFCFYIQSCLHLMQRADLIHIFEQGFCGNRDCPVHMKKVNSEDEYYEQGPGLCVIINQKLFYEDKSHPDAQKLDDRLGTDIDRNELEATFLLFGADIIIFNDLTHEEMIKSLESAAERANHKKYSWVAVSVLSHGRRLNGVDEILGCNGVGVDRKLIINTFADASKCPNLQRKAKMFFFQACRGNESTTTTIHSTIASDGAVQSIDGWPALGDYMVASATIEDFVSFRSTIDGSFFIRHLCNELQNHGHEKSIADIMIRVNAKANTVYLIMDSI